MKKILVLSAVVALAVSAKADFTWSWWCDKTDAKTDISLGLATKCKSVSAVDLSLIYSASCVENGVQVAFPGICDSDKAKVLQGSLWFNRGDDSCAQVSCVNVAKNNIFSLGFLNFAKTSKVQIGFLNFDENGFLPVFIFFNLDKSLFTSEKK